MNHKIKYRMLSLSLLLAVTSQADAHLSHSVGGIHVSEHLLLLAALLAPALLLIKPLKRYLSRRAQQD